MTYYYPSCPNCGKEMICIEEHKRERIEHVAGFEYYERFEEFLCPDCRITKKYTDTRTTTKDD